MEGRVYVLVGISEHRFARNIESFLVNLCPVVRGKLPDLQILKAASHRTLRTE